MPRNKDLIWNNFICKTKERNNGKWAIHKICKKEMQGNSKAWKYMEIHYELCSIGIDKNMSIYNNIYLFITIQYLF